MRQNHGQEALRIDQPVAALLGDLRQRGMLDDTLILFTSEFGRTPFTQSSSDVLGAGRAVGDIIGGGEIAPPALIGPPVPMPCGTLICGICA